ncbi:MAG: hypothetical protein IKH15_12090 [Bacteroidales bacterium]|nr:hypothetical protein [Bacteroidales bacterium]
MLQDKTLRLRAQLSVLRDVQKNYPGRTIENIIQNLEARLDYHIKHQPQNDTERIPATGDDNMPARE